MTAVRFEGTGGRTCRLSVRGDRMSGSYTSTRQGGVVEEIVYTLKKE